MTLELLADHLVFRFPEVHEDAVLRVTFQRTLRVPDDGREHWLPPGLGAFPVRDVHSFDDRLPLEWRDRGGVVLPMWQAEACWISFSSTNGYPMAVKIAAGKINAVTGNPWQDALDHEQQDFVEVPAQPWLDGFCVKKGVVRQFVAMPLGEGYTAEEQLSGTAEFGGVQILVRPLDGVVWQKRKEAEAREFRETGAEWASAMLCEEVSSPVAMGLAAGGSIRQEIVEATESPRHWAPPSTRERCFVHLINSAQWQQYAGSPPPTAPPSAADYTRAGLPWFHHYSDRPAIDGSSKLASIQTVLELGAEKGESPLDGNESFVPPTPIVVGKVGKTTIEGKDGDW